MNAPTASDRYSVVKSLAAAEKVLGINLKGIER